MNDYYDFFHIIGFSKNDSAKLAESIEKGAVRHCGKMAAVSAAGFVLAVGFKGPDKKLAAATAAVGGVIAGAIYVTACTTIKNKILRIISEITGKTEGLSPSTIIAKMSQQQRKDIVDTANELLRLDIPMEQRMQEQENRERFSA
jgi:hypothetical protein